MCNIGALSNRANTWLVPKSRGPLWESPLCCEGITRGRVWSLGMCNEKLALQWSTICADAESCMKPTCGERGSGASAMKRMHRGFEFSRLAPKPLFAMNRSFHWRSPHPPPVLPPLQNKFFRCKAPDSRPLPWVRKPQAFVPRNCLLQCRVFDPCLLHCKGGSTIHTPIALPKGLLQC